MFLKDFLVIFLNNILKWHFLAIFINDIFWSIFCDLLILVIFLSDFFKQDDALNDQWFVTSNAEAYPEPSRRSKMELFAKIVND